MTVIDFTDTRWGHNVAWASHDSGDVEEMLVVTTPAPKIGDIVKYYVEDAVIIACTWKRNPKDMYRLKVQKHEATEHALPPKCGTVAFQPAASSVQTSPGIPV